jgi:hypothetical protein
MKAIATVSMYDMGGVNRNGLNHSQSLGTRKQFVAAASEQRYVEFLGGKRKYVDGMLDSLRPDAGPIEREFFDFYGVVAYIRARRGGLTFTRNGRGRCPC